jgi:hypothetical protein
MRRKNAVQTQFNIDDGSGMTELKNAIGCANCGAGLSYVGEITIGPASRRFARHGETETLVIRCITCGHELPRFQILRVPAGCAAGKS